MTVTTRSANGIRKPRAVPLMYARAPAPPLEGARKHKPKPSSEAVNPSRSKTARQGSKAAPARTATKRSRKTVDTEATIAARKARQAELAEKDRIKWEAVVAKHPPRKTLTLEDLPQRDETAPHRLYGWPFTEEYMLDYARRHRLVLEVFPCHRQHFGYASTFNYGDLTDAHLADRELAPSLLRCSVLDVISHFFDEADAISLTVERPVSQEWPWLLVLWTTEDYEDKYGMYRMYGTWRKVRKFIDDALNECLPEGCERRTSLEWWWSCMNVL